jgi:hypothetical protein
LGIAGAAVRSSADAPLSFRSFTEGLTEEELKAQGAAYKSGGFPFTADARAKVSHEADGGLIQDRVARSRRRASPRWTGR